MFIITMFLQRCVQRKKTAGLSFIHGHLWSLLLPFKMVEIVCHFYFMTVPSPDDWVMVAIIYGGFKFQYFISMDLLQLHYKF